MGGLKGKVQQSHSSADVSGFAQAVGAVWNGNLRCWTSTPHNKGDFSEYIKATLRDAEALSGHSFCPCGGEP